MRRYLVVANRTLGGRHLVQRFRECLAEGPCRFHVLVPASPDPHAWIHDDDSDRELAERRLRQALEAFGELGFEVTGEVGDHRPVDAVLDVMRREDFDEVIVSTLPPGASRWLRLDLVSRVQRAVDVPVGHVIAKETPVGAG